MAATAVAHAQLLPVPSTELLDEEPVDQRRYSVEIIVFTYADSVSSGNEIFTPDLPATDAAAPLDESNRDAEGVVEFGDFIERNSGAGIDAALEAELVELPSLASINFRRLQPEEMTMGSIYEKLNKLDAYKPVLWGGWSQTALDRSQTRSIRLRILGAPPLSIDGELTLYLQNFLHLVVDVTLQETAPVDELAGRDRNPLRNSGDWGQSGMSQYAAPSISFHILEDRIFRSGELRYFDHPKFGVIARIHRVDGTIEDFVGDELLETIE